MTQRKSYGAYRESGIKWLGRIPENWSIYRVKSTIEFSQNGVWGEDPDGGSDDIECARVADFDRVSFTVSDNLATYRKVPEAQRRSREVKDGDLLFEKSGGGEKTLVGAIVQYKGSKAIICSNFVSVIKVKSGVNSRWLCYVNAFLYSIGVNSRSIKQATGIQNIDSEQYFSERIPVPSKLEQDRIAIWLDRETARIDTLIAKKTRFIDLLKEKRQAVITKAVTKGLDDSVEMKESGAFWIGKTPAHWAVCKLSYRYSVELGKMLDEKKLTGLHPVPYLRNKDVQWEQINSSNLPFMDIFPNERERYTVRSGDLLVCEGGDVGRAAIWKGADNIIGFQKALHRLRSLFPDRDLAEFYFYSLFTAKKSGLFEESGTKSTISHLPAEKFREYRFSFPPFNEQVKIVAYLREVTGRIDTLIEKTERSIELLKEHRSALITAAVTGKIDVREAA